MIFKYVIFSILIGVYALDKTILDNNYDFYMKMLRDFVNENNTQVYPLALFFHERSFVIILNTIYKHVAPVSTINLFTNNDEPNERLIITLNVSYVKSMRFSKSFVHELSGNSDFASRDKGIAIYSYQGQMYISVISKTQTAPCLKIYDYETLQIVNGSWENGCFPYVESPLFHIYFPFDGKDQLQFLNKK